MTTSYLESPPQLIRFASFPGGVARQFRVQVLETQSGHWQLHANFPYRDQAGACWQQLVSTGLEARIVDASSTAVFG
jgi:hypothetical protein